MAECNEPGCTGVHSGGKPRSTWCPRLKRDHDRRPYRRSIGGQTMKYLADMRYGRRRRDGRQED